MKVITQPKTDEPSADELEALIEEARQRQRRRRLGFLLVGFVSLALIAGLAMLFESKGDDRASGGSPTAQSLGAPRADSLYLRVNTTPRLVSVDPQTGRTNTLPVVLPCGDTPFCLIGSGDRLVISGVGRTVALDPSGDTKPTTSGIGHGWITVPSQEPGRVWLGILKRGARPSATLSEFREVDLDGRTLRVVPAPDGRWAAASVSDGLLFVNRTLRLWSFDERRFTQQIPGRIPADTNGDLVASCGWPCLRFAITDTATGETTRVAPPDGFGWTGGSEGAFSPDGSLVVLPVSHDPRGIRSHNDALALVDVSSGTAELVPGTTELDSQYRAMTWSPDGQRLYFVADPATIRSYRLGAPDSRHVASVPVGRGNVLQMVAVPREQ